MWNMWAYGTGPVLSMNCVLILLPTLSSLVHAMRNSKWMNKVGGWERKGREGGRGTEGGRGREGEGQREGGMESEEGREKIINLLILSIFLCSVGVPSEEAILIPHHHCIWLALLDWHPPPYSFVLLWAGFPLRVELQERHNREHLPHDHWNHCPGHLHSHGSEQHQAPSIKAPFHPILPHSLGGGCCVLPSLARPWCTLLEPFLLEVASPGSGHIWCRAHPQTRYPTQEEDQH